MAGPFDRLSERIGASVREAMQQADEEGQRSIVISLLQKVADTSAEEMAVRTGQVPSEPGPANASRFADLQPIGQDSTAPMRRPTDLAQVSGAGFAANQQWLAKGGHAEQAESATSVS